MRQCASSSIKKALKSILPARTNKLRHSFMCSFNMKVLLIEDEVKLAQAIHKGLSLYNYMVSVAHNAIDGKAMALKEGFDVIVSDVIMPGQNGVEMVADLRRQGCRTPILLLTALGQIEDKEQGFDGGADDYLTKPFEFRELLLRVRALTRRTSPPPPNVLRYADLELRPTRQEALRSGQLIQLTQREFALLEYFVNHPERIISKQEISEQVWNLDFDTGTNLVEVYVTFLRRKLDKGFDKKLIHTVIRSGYILREE